MVPFLEICYLKIRLISLKLLSAAIKHQIILMQNTLVERSKAKSLHLKTAIEIFSFAEKTKRKSQDINSSFNSL